MNRLRTGILGGFVLGFGAWLIVACGRGDPIDSTCSATDPDPPPEEPPTACAEPVKPCPMFRIELQGDLTKPEVRANYKAAFVSACYVAATSDTFNCYFKDLETACAKGFSVPKVYGAAEYEGEFPCVPDGDGIWSRQVGSDPAIKMRVYLENAPVETSNIDVDGGASIAINGPYRNLPQLTTIKPGEDFYCKTSIPGPDGGTLSQRDWFIQVNKSANDGGIRSDMAGFVHPCKTGCPDLCTEPTFLEEGNQYAALAPQVNHVARRKDLRSCDWGSNANSNAAVISGRLNRYFKNKYPLKDEVEHVNKAPPYTYTP